MVKTKRRTRLIISSLLILLSGSLLANGILFRFGRSYYLQLNALRLDPIGLSIPFADGRALDNTQTKTVVMLGDSRIESWPNPEVEGINIINRGIGGQTSAQVLARYPYQVAPLQPDLLLVQVGVNDLKTIPLFPHERDKIVAELKQNITTLVTAAQEQEAPIILTTIFPLGEVPVERRPFWSDEVAIAIEEVNLYIKSLESDQVIVFDTYTLLADDDGQTKDAFSPDLLHLNEQGYLFLNDHFARMIDQS